jgi:hypothetical protein
VKRVNVIGFFFGSQMMVHTAFLSLFFILLLLRTILHFEVYGIGNVFGMTQIFAYCLFASFWFAVIPHGFEAAIAVYYCLTTLRPHDIGPTFLWGFLIFLVGYPIFNEMQDLLGIQKSYDPKLHKR